MQKSLVVIINTNNSPITNLLMNSFRLFEFKRKLEVFSSVEDFFELHSWATEEKKTKTELKTVIF